MHIPINLNESLVVDCFADNLTSLCVIHPQSIWIILINYIGPRTISLNFCPYGRKQCDQFQNGALGTMPESL